MNLRSATRLRAFTLMEVMIALFLMSFIVAAVYSSWLAVVRGHKAAAKAAAEVQRSRIALETIEGSLMAARMFVASQDYYYFQAENGSRATLSFVARLSDNFPRASKFGDAYMRRVSFVLEPGRDSGHRLVLRQAPFLLDFDEDEQLHPVVLARNVRKFEMEFWDIRDREWKDEWTQTNQLPTAIKINFQMESGNSAKPEEALSKIIFIPSSSVQATWQGRRGGNNPRAGRNNRFGENANPEVMQ
jgi:prepilin-type N-terminal cleavage/methylation domain-containing protein